MSYHATIPANSNNVYGHMDLASNVPVRGPKSAFYGFRAALNPVRLRHVAIQVPAHANVVLGPGSRTA